MSNASHWSRRDFIAALGALSATARFERPIAGAPALIGLTKKSDRYIAGGFVDDDGPTGHQLRDGVAFAGAREQRTAAVAIVGGGIGGLSAGWRLDALGVRDWLLLELGAETGGNARGGENSISRYPWGAHYVPVPGVEATHVRELFRELGVLSADGVWDERTLCHSPQERLFQHGRWHEGLEPVDGLSRWERNELLRWDERVREWRASGAFRVPMGDVREHTRSAALQRSLQQLDGQSALSLLQSQQFKSPALRWWVEYGTRDDYGASLQQASGWAAVHYFAAREASEQGPLTWPEGNNFIVRHLSARAGVRAVTNAPVYAVQKRGSKWLVRSPKVDVLCDVVIWAAPLFVMPRVFDGLSVPAKTEYAPWVVANVTLERTPDEHGFPLAWDNVLYDSPSLGYVNATHQRLGETGPHTVWTWYHAVVDRPADAGRRWLQSVPWTMWRDYIVADLSRAHPDVRNSIARIDVRRWGHAMARPVPGILNRMQTLREWVPAKRVFVAHADLTGFSLFEEAQWHAVQAANGAAKVLQG